MKRVAKFLKVSFEEFEKGFTDCFGEQQNISQIYENINLPKRATVGSAGYDFFTPYDIKLKP